MPSEDCTMGDQPIDFVKRFHSLDGDAISDRKKNFNKLLRDPLFSTNKQLIHNALENLEPKTYLESLFKVDALVYFKHTAQLFNIIKGGNEVFISKILKQHWFIEEVFQNMDADSLVNEFLPCLSFAMRLKVMKKLSMLLKQEKVDDIFNCVHKRYGLWIATKMLHCCSKATVASLLKNEEIKLRVNQVQHLCNRTDGVLELYLEYYKKTFAKTFSESKITDYIAKKNPALLLKLINEKKIDASRLGRRTSKNVFGLVEDVVKNDIQQYYKYERLLNKPVFVKKLGADFQNIYVKIFPKRVEDIGSYSECRTILQNYPKKKRWTLFSQTFRTKIPDKNISEVFTCFGKQIMTLYPTKDVVINWAQFNYEKSNNEKFLKYLHPSKSIPLLKEKINVTSDATKRGVLVKLLLQTCKKNDDLKALEDVLKYFCFRHRNEEIYFRRNFLSNIEQKFRPKLNKFNAAHWKYINEQIKILTLLKELQFWSMAPLLSRYLEYLFENGEDYKDALMDFVNNCIRERHFFLFNLNNPKTEKKILLEMLRIFPDAIKTVTGDQKSVYNSLLDSIFEFCDKYPDHFIDVGEWDYLKTFFNKELQNCTEENYTVFSLFANVLKWQSKFPQMTLCAFDNNTIDLIVTCCQNGGYNSFRLYIKNSLMKNNRSDFETQLMLTYFNNISKDHPEVDIVNFFVKYDPKLVTNHFSEFCRKYLRFNAKVIKLLSHLDFDKQLKIIYTSQLESVDLDYHLNVIQVLRDLLPTEEFAVLINNKFIPTKAKLDLEDADVSKLYDLKCKIAKQLHKVEEPVKILPVVLKFCIGDYFQSALPSLQGVFYKSPEKKLNSYLEELSGKAVSVRKHAVFLSCEVENQEHVVNILTSTEESNVSSQKHLFTATLKYFRKNPSSELQDLVIKNMSTIDKNDTETLDNLAKTTVPKKYRGVYIEKCWGFYESLQSEGVSVKEYFDSLLRNVTDHIEILTSIIPSFVENIINKYYFNTDINDIIGDFIVKYLNHGGYKEQKLLGALIQKLTALKKRDLENFVGNLRNCADKEKEFMMAFSKHWNQFFSTANAFKEHIMVELLILDSAKSSVKNLAEKIVSYFDKIISEFTLCALPLLIEIFNDFVTSKENKDIFELSNELLNVKTTAYLCILVLKVVSPIIDEDVEEFVFYNNIMGKIRNVEDPVVRIYHKNFMSEHNVD